MMTTTNMVAEPEFSRSVPVQSITKKPITQTLNASAEECAVLAARFNLPKIHSLKAQLKLWHDGIDVVVSGSIHAKLAQECVLSLEAFDTVLQDSFMTKFRSTNGKGECLIDDDEGDVEPILGEYIDLGELVAQNFALALDPYPKAPNAKVPALNSPFVHFCYEDSLQRVTSPFSALAALNH